MNTFPDNAKFILSDDTKLNFKENFLIHCNFIILDKINKEDFEFSESMIKITLAYLKRKLEENKEN